MKVRIVIILFLGCIANIVCGQQQIAPEQQADRLEKYISRMEAKGFSGSVLVATKGSKILSRGYGNANIGTKNTNNTVFDIGSVTKQFTSAGILTLEMQGLLSTNDKIDKYIVGVPSDGKVITIHHLLTHSAGLPDAIGNDYEQISEEEFLKTAFSKIKKDQIGTRHEYSNVGYTILALIIEKVSGQNYENYLRRNLFLPAGMEQTGYVLPQWNTKHVAMGYAKKDPWGTPLDQNWDTDGPYLHLKGNGGILSTVEDLYKWHLALLNDRILSSEAKKKYYGKHIKEEEDGDFYYGYGWAIFPTRRNTQLITHNGGNGIFFADFWRYLTEDITIIVLANKSDEKSENMAANLARILLTKN